MSEAPGRQACTPDGQGTQGSWPDIRGLRPAQLVPSKAQGGEEEGARQGPLGLLGDGGVYK